MISDLSRRASVRVEGPKTVAFEGATSPGDGLSNGNIHTVKPKSRSGSIIGAISPILGTGKHKKMKKVFLTLLLCQMRKTSS